MSWILQSAAPDVWCSVSSQFFVLLSLPFWNYFQHIFHPFVCCHSDSNLQTFPPSDNWGKVASSLVFLMLMVKLTHHWQLFLLDHVVCCMDNLQGLPLCWFVIDVSKVGTWDFLCHHWKKHWLENGFTFNALNKSKHLFM